jgi:hypothetical protein
MHSTDSPIERYISATLSLCNRIELPYPIFF